MKKRRTLFLGLGLIGLSAVLHLIHLLIFKDLHHLVIYLWGDIAFIPLEVFFITFVLDKFIEKREKDQLKEKANMMVGLFYQELGSALLTMLSRYDGTLDQKKTEVQANWSEEDYDGLNKYLTAQKLHLNLEKADYAPFRLKIEEKLTLIMNMLTNQALHEHELFTESLMSVFHLLEELNQREGRPISDQDRNHLKIDMERVYRNLAAGWVHYLVYLKEAYPYLYASAIRTNPFM